MISVEDFAQLLRDNQQVTTFPGSTYVTNVYIGPRLPESNAQNFILLTELPGTGSTLEGLFALMRFQILVRGPQNTYKATHDQAWNIDKYLMHDLVTPYTFPNGGYMTHINWTASGPAPNTVNNQAIMYEFSCDYIAHVALY